MSLVGPESALRGDVEVLAQPPPDVAQVMSTLDELVRRGPETAENMGPRDPGAEGIAELPADQPVEFCTSHTHTLTELPQRTAHTWPHPT